MKKSISYIVLIAALSVGVISCSKSFVDINEPNPNKNESSNPDGILPGALNTTAYNLQYYYNTYGSWVAGYWAKTGVVNGYAPERTYSYTSAYYSSLWDYTYPNIENYRLLEVGAKEKGLGNHEAIAKIMKVYNFQLLVDEYGNIPYTSALKGRGGMAPKYDKAEDIYKNFIIQLDSAILLIDSVSTKPLIPKPTTTDIVFKGDMQKWRRFANSLKLRVLLRQSQVVSLDTYVKEELIKMPTSANNYASFDVSSNPGYLKTLGKQNPFWERFWLNAAGNVPSEAKYVRGTKYAVSQYDTLNGTDNRLKFFYKKSSNPGVGYNSPVLGEANPPDLKKSCTFGPGVFKTFDMPAVLMLSAETYFLLAEAKARGYIGGGDGSAEYQEGIRASFKYLYNTSSAAVSPNNAAAIADADAYVLANAGKSLIDWTASTNKQETIIYQKWLALNLLMSIEAWSEYRRTGFPKDIPASLESTSTRADKLPVRLLYPQSEISTNSANLNAQGVINQFTSRIFWDVN